LHLDTERNAKTRHELGQYPGNLVEPCSGDQPGFHQMEEANA
jgi:hypothetical protein